MLVILGSLSLAVEQSGVHVRPFSQGVADDAQPTTVKFSGEASLSWERTEKHDRLPIFRCIRLLFAEPLSTWNQC